MARVSPKYSNTEIMEFSTIPIIEIGFGKNSLTKKKGENPREVKISPHPRLSSGNSITPTKETKKKRDQWGNTFQSSGCSLQLVELIPL